LNPLVSIIIPNYNHEQFLMQRLDSILNQTFQDFEIILLDDCSTDKSNEIIKKYDKHPKVSHCLFNKVNSGNTFVQWNKGIKLAVGEFIWIAESDDYCDPLFLETVIKPLENDNNIVLSYTQSHSVSENGSITGNWLTHTNKLNTSFFLNDFIIEGNNFIKDFLIYKNVIPNASAVVFRKNIAKKNGGVNEDNKLRTCSDWLFYFEIIFNNKIAYNHNSLNSYRQHDKSVIAKLSKNESRLHIINTLLYVRSLFKKQLKIYKIQDSKKILKINNQLSNKLVNEKGIILLKKSKYIQGSLFLLKGYWFLLKNWFKYNGAN
jgi:glycosyltransferase involved in cell wall biosynthesis